MDGKALHSGVVRRAPLLRHGVRKPVVMADPEPPGPSVTASAIAMGHRPLGEPAASILQHDVGHLCRWAHADRPRGRHATKAVYDRTQISLSGGDRELITSISHNLFGALAWKFRSTMLSGTFPTSPLWEL